MNENQGGFMQNSSDTYVEQKEVKKEDNAFDYKLMQSSETSNDGYCSFSQVNPIFKETLDAVTTEDENGCKMLNQYVIKQKIGVGSFGTVSRCIDTLTGKAIKDFSKIRLRKAYEFSCFKKPRSISNSFVSDHVSFYRNSSNHSQKDNPLDFIQKEVTIMKKINHRNIVRLIEVLDDPHGDSLYMANKVLEMCEKGVVMNMDINNVVSPYSESKCRKWFRDLILGIEYLHAHGICHCDIKPGNLLLSKDGTLKISDFGISKMFTKDDDAFYKVKGTPAFMAPELCILDHVVSCKAADIWSMGITLWCLAFGYLPFNDSDIMKLYDMIKTQKIEVPHHVSFQLKDLFEKILEKDPEKRIKMNGLRQHDWVTLNGEDPMISYKENTMGIIEEITDKDFNTAICTIQKASDKTSSAEVYANAIF
ncbi:hypothetical protein PORY_001674 [Pneumocystis oryctolagi]|uniref:Uncharacterized protein n=1 Tax=Pneumocystis oryctolagi TaxID=42067 RepID=A0ACB7CHV6_9ASCO|nr:hypothetical protein PORY_001674 [Pneumocystis oryctolagi]